MFKKERKKGVIEKWASISSFDYNIDCIIIYKHCVTQCIAK